MNPQILFRTLRTAALVSIFISPSCRGWAQTPIDSLIKKFDDFRSHNIQEKLYVHIDRTTHLVGETLWFKVYCVNGTTHAPLSLSKVAYVEILSSENESLVQRKIQLVAGVGEGSCFLPATMKSGNFILRAYTQWMRNYDASFFFHQPITIINPFQPNQHETSKPSLSYDAQFLPEGGHLVEGLRSKVGFRVIDAHGKGIEFSGSVIDSHADTIVKFAPKQFGIGAFELTPAANVNYKAVIRDTHGNVLTFALPDVFPEGYSLRVERTSDGFQVIAQARFLRDTNPEVFLLVHTRNQIVSSISGKLLNGKISFTIPNSKLDDGISHITLFDHRLSAVCERLIFKRPEIQLTIGAVTNEPVYGNRDIVKLSLCALDKSKSPATANLSVSIFKIDSLPSFARTQISPYLLLSSDLSGGIESPHTYFQPNAEESIDHLMLTHGWRRIKWDHILKQPGRSFSFLPEFNGLTVKGELLTKDGRPAPGVLTFLSFPSSDKSFFTTRSRSNGGFAFVLKKVFGSGRIVFQTYLRDSLFQFKIESPFSNVYLETPSPRLSIDPKLENSIVERSVGMQVQDIFKSEPTQKFTLQDSTAFYGAADETYFLDDFTRFTVMEEVMREYVPGVLVRKRKGKFYFLVHDVVNNATFKEEPLILVDGVPVFDTDKIMAFDPLKFRKLEVVTKLFFHGQTAFPGIVSFSTYKGDLAGFELNPRSVVIDYEGLQIKREFYSPQYNNNEAKLSRVPDERNLLFWAPQVNVANGTAELEFFTSDQSGYFQIEIEGITSTGQMGSTTSSFLVKRNGNN